MSDHDEAVRWGVARASREETILVDCSCDDSGCTEQVEFGFSDDSDDLLARLDSARDDAFVRWLDGEIDKARTALRAAEREADLIDLVDDDSAVGANEYVRWQTLREVRDRLGATTNTTPEGGTDD